MTRFTWTPDAVASLRAMYPDHTSGHVATALGCSTKAVHNKAHEQGLHKSPSFFASTRSGRIERGRTDPRMKATQIKPGQAPWNKGKPGATGLHPNCRPTQFKSLQPHEHRNYVPIGSLRLNKDGLLERKVTDDRSIAPARRWKAEHRLVWEAANGPTPPGHIVVFRPGCRTAVLQEITLDRLECISRAENARRNHPMNVSPEFAKVAQLRGAITRQVNRIIKESRA
jgi:hypothetical protein